MVRHCTVLQSLMLPMRNFDIPTLVPLLPESMPTLEKLRMTMSSDFPVTKETLSDLVRRAPNVKVFKA